MTDSQRPVVIDADARERLGEQILALAEDIFRLNDSRLDAIMGELMLRVSKAIAKNPNSSPRQDRSH